jgi:hypothetical protein
MLLLQNLFSPLFSTKTANFCIPISCSLYRSPLRRTSRRKCRKWTRVGEQERGSEGDLQREERRKGRSGILNARSDSHQGGPNSFSRRGGGRRRRRGRSSRSTAVPVTVSTRGFYQRAVWELGFRPQLRERQSVASLLLLLILVAVLLCARHPSKNRPTLHHFSMIQMTLNDHPTMTPPSFLLLLYLLLIPSHRSYAYLAGSGFMPI